MSLEVDFPKCFLACDISIISRQIVLNLILGPLQYWSQAATEKVIGSILFLSQSSLPHFYLNMYLFWFPCSLPPHLSDPFRVTALLSEDTITQQLQYFLPPSRWCHGFSLSYQGPPKLRVLVQQDSACRPQWLHWAEVTLWLREGIWTEKKITEGLIYFSPSPSLLFFFFKWAVWGNHRCPFLLQDLWSLPSFFHYLSLSHHPFFIAQSDHSQWNVKTNYVRALNWPLRPREQVSSVDNAIWTNQRVFIVSRRK